MTLFFTFFFFFCIVENRSKRDLIQMLVQRGYESDPVKAWKEAQEKVMIRNLWIHLMLFL